MDPTPGWAPGQAGGCAAGNAVRLSVHSENRGLVLLAYVPASGMAGRERAARRSSLPRPTPPVSGKPRPRLSSGFRSPPPPPLRPRGVGCGSQAFVSEKAGGEQTWHKSISSPAKPRLCLRNQRERAKLELRQQTRRRLALSPGSACFLSRPCWLDPTSRLSRAAFWRLSSLLQVDSTFPSSQDAGWSQGPN